MDLVKNYFSDLWGYIYACTKICIYVVKDGYVIVFSLLYM